MRQGELAGMPEPAALRLLAADGQVLVTHGRTLVYRYEADDTGMRNLAIVALTDAGRRIDEVALLFGLTATYVSMLRGRRRSMPRSPGCASRCRPPRTGKPASARGSPVPAHRRPEDAARPAPASPPARPVSCIQSITISTDSRRHGAKKGPAHRAFLGTT